MYIEVVDALLIGAESVEALRVGVSDVGVRDFWPQQQFQEQGILAIIEMGRMLARFMIMLTVLVAGGYWTYGSYMLMSAGGDPQRLDKGRAVFKSVLVGVAISVGSYLIVTGAVNIYVGASGVAQIVQFWDPAVFDDGLRLGELFTDTEIAVAGEVLLFGGSVPVVCQDGLETAAVNAGWVWQDALRGIDGVGGCSR